MTAEKKPSSRVRKRPPQERFGGLAEQVRGGKTAGGSLASSGLTESVGFVLRVASGVAQGSLSGRLERLGLRQSLYSVLLIIHEDPGLKQQEVGQTLSIQQPNLVALINELVERGLVIRSVNADDRRSYSLKLSPAGQALLRQANVAHAENERALAGAIAPLSVKEFRAALVRVLGLNPPKGK